MAQSLRSKLCLETRSNGDRRIRVFSVVQIVICRADIRLIMDAIVGEGLVSSRNIRYHEASCFTVKNAIYTVNPVFLRYCTSREDFSMTESLGLILLSAKLV